MESEEEFAEPAPPTRGEIAEYVHDMTGQLAAMAERSGLAVAAVALRKAQRVIESEY